MNRLLWLVCTAVVFTLTNSQAEVRFGLASETNALDAGQTVRLDVVVPTAGDAFNGYDAVLYYDETKVEPVVPSPPSSGEGELFTNACGIRFLDIADLSDSSKIRVAHVILCAGTSVTGPGAVYSMEFRALANGITTIELGPGTQAYEAGELVDTVTGANVTLTIGDVTTTPRAPGVPRLRVFPNPFNPSTTVRIEGEPGTFVRLKIHDSAGRRVRTLFEARLDVSRLDLRWDGRDAFGRFVASGTYFAHLQTTERSAVSRLVLVR